MTLNLNDNTTFSSDQVEFDQVCYIYHGFFNLHYIKKEVYTN